MSTSESTAELHDNQAMLSSPIPFRGSLTVREAYAAISLARPLGNRIAMWIVRAFFVATLIYMCWLTADESWFTFLRLAGEKLKKI